MLEDITGQEIKDQFKTNKKLRLIVFSIGGALLLVIGYLAYHQFVVKPTTEKSKDAYWEGLNYAKSDSTEAAIAEFKSAVKKYDGHIGGEVSQFLYARQLMNTGEFKKALEQLEEVETEDTYVSVLCIGLQADCKSEMGKYSEASTQYIEAANMIDNDFTSPMFLKKAAVCAEELKDFKKATEYYKRIIKEYPTFASQNEIEKYLARSSNIKVK